MSLVTPLLVFLGTLVGAFIGPLLLEEYREWKQNRVWKKPRKTLLKAKLDGAKGQGWISLDTLTTLIGTSDDQCRSLLIEIEARGGTLRSGCEGWALISRRPLSDSDKEDEIEGKAKNE